MASSTDSAHLSFYRAETLPNLQKEETTFGSASVFSNLFFTSATFPFVISSWASVSGINLNSSKSYRNEPKTSPLVLHTLNLSSSKRVCRALG